MVRRRQTTLKSDRARARHASPGTYYIYIYIYITLQVKIQERRIQDMNERLVSSDKEKLMLEKSLDEKRRLLDESLASLKENRGLSAMLQEQHSTLMNNNNVILQANQQMKERHEQEINQMHLSYQQLRKSFDVWREANRQQN